MDPAGLGPVTMMFTNGRTFTSIEENVFSKFMSKLHRERVARNSHAKIIVGGPGSWELSYLPGKVKELHVDHVIQGEIDDAAPDLFDHIAEGSRYLTLSYSASKPSMNTIARCGPWTPSESSSRERLSRNNSRN